MTKVAISLSKNNPARRKRLREARNDKVSGNHLSQTAPRVVTSIRGDNLRRGNEIFDHTHNLGSEIGNEFSGDDPSSVDPEIDAYPDVDNQPDVDAIVEEKGTPMPKVKKVSVSMDAAVSEAADVIFYPATQATRYSGRTAIKRNIERRMPGYVCKVFDVDGEGQADFSIAADIDVGGINASVEARCRAATMDMALRSVTIWVGGRKFALTPVDKARSPEDTSVFLSRLATNVVKITDKTPLPVGQ